MANALWGKVYFQDSYAGRLQEEPGGRCVFTYDSTYLINGQPIAYTLPLQAEPHISERGLHPFFDNLVAEGWFRNAQAKALGINPQHRFALLLGFGHDLAGAVSLVDPEPQEYKTLDHADEATIAALLGRASLSGIQRKLLVVKDGRNYRPVQSTELSTHIAKLASGNLANLLEIEYLTTQAIKKLLPDDEIVDMEIDTITAIKERALIIPRFDRSPSGKRIHFEEFNQLLNKYSGDDKYDGTYEDMANFMLQTTQCTPMDVEKIFQRILACLLVGNTDAHFKNFAMFHARDGLRLTPAYDLVAAAIYPQFQNIALNLAGITNLAIGSLLPKHVMQLGRNFNLQAEYIIHLIEVLGKNLANALSVIENASIGNKKLHSLLIEKMEKRWNGSFSLIGPWWSKKQSSGEKRTK